MSSTSKVQFGGTLSALEKYRESELLCAPRGLNWAQVNTNYLSFRMRTEESISGTFIGPRSDMDLLRHVNSPNSCARPQIQDTMQLLRYFYHM